MQQGQIIHQTATCLSTDIDRKTTVLSINIHKNPGFPPSRPIVSGSGGLSIP